MTEDFEYLHLLYDAVDGGSGINRMTALVGFVASSYASWYGRQQKPFAPTLGETYDWTSPDGRVRVVCEQVIYADPPACAFRATGTTPGGRRFVVDGEGAGISKFWGKYVQIVVQGGLHMELPDTGETFSWSKASMHVHNVISGRIWIDMVGEVTVLAHKTGESAKFRLLKGKRPEPGKPDVRGKIDGEVYDAAGNCVAHVQGNVLGKVWARPDPTYVPPPGGEALHERFRVGEGDDSAEAATSTGGFATPIFEFGGVAPDAARQYGFTRFAITLNELSPEMLRNLPPTDSRFRPDMRALEDGHPETASKEKVRVEDRNRALAAARKRAGGRHQPAWFEKRAPTPGGQTWGKHVNFLEHQCALWVYKGDTGNSARAGVDLAAGDDGREVRHLRPRRAVSVDAKGTKEAKRRRVTYPSVVTHYNMPWSPCAWWCMIFHSSPCTSKTLVAASIPTPASEFTFSTHVTNPHPSAACTRTCSAETSMPAPGGMVEKTMSQLSRTWSAPLMHALPGWRHWTWSPTPHTRRIASASAVRNA